MASKDVNKDKETQIWTHKRRKRSKFSVGDFVRLSIKKVPFMKRYQEICTEEVLIIHAIVC